jgi:hypothetical protein
MINDRESIEAILTGQKFTFAKTMANIPHEYTLRKNWASDQDFINVVNFIREHGKEERFFRKTFVYYYCNGYKYWTMGNPMDITRLINRAKV